MRKYLKKLHFLYYQFVIGVVFISIYPLVYFFSRKPVNVKGLNFMRRVLSMATAKLSGISFTFRFEEPIDWSRPYIICANHTSNLDISTIILLVKRNFVFMGKEELLENMVTRIYFQTIDIPINRNSKISSYRGLKRAEESLRNGMHVVIFPEGMIAEAYPPVLNPFKMGPFKLAIEQKIAILPVTIQDNWKLLWDDGTKLGSSPGVSKVIVHAPLETTELTLTDAEELRNKVFHLINHHLNNNNLPNIDHIHVSKEDIITN
jgi:1-acyl-sn-glycerol-3-phosphate acyltransferase